MTASTRALQGCRGGLGVGKEFGFMGFILCTKTQGFCEAFDSQESGANLNVFLVLCSQELGVS